MDGTGFDHNVNLWYGWIKKGQEKLFKTNTKVMEILEKEVTLGLLRRKMEIQSSDRRIL